MELTQEQVRKLKDPLPEEAVSPHPTKSYLSTIKAIYVVERLNEVFGLGGWKVVNEIVENKNGMVVVKSKFTAGDIEVEAFGGNDNADLGDAYKGACTDALTKIGSYLYVGMDVYKGLREGHQTRTPHKTPEKATSSPVSTVTCEHNQPAKRVQTKKAGPNQGRWFYACAHPKENQCDYFQWEDELNKPSQFDDKYRQVDYGEDDFREQEARESDMLNREIDQHIHQDTDR